jgi:hypothetical protein
MKHHQNDFFSKENDCIENSDLVNLDSKHFKNGCNIDSKHTNLQKSQKYTNII